MLIINADDWGRSSTETDVIVKFFKDQRITSVSAMVYMDDSERAARIAIDTQIDVGLHLNFSQPFALKSGNSRLYEYHERIINFLTKSKYALIFYNSRLKKEFHYVYQAQFDEFVRLYGKLPSHINGHHHYHLCTNMLIDRIIPSKQKVRRSFSFWPGMQNLLKRGYRRLVDYWLTNYYIVTDYFIALPYFINFKNSINTPEISNGITIELMTHPFHKMDYDYLMSKDYQHFISNIEKGTYSDLIPSKD